MIGHDDVAVGVVVVNLERGVVARRDKHHVVRRAVGLLCFDIFARRRSVLVFRNGLIRTERSEFAFRRVGYFDDLDSGR